MLLEVLTNDCSCDFRLTTDLDSQYVLRVICDAKAAERLGDLLLYQGLSVPSGSGTADSHYYSQRVRTQSQSERFDSSVGRVTCH